MMMVELRELLNQLVREAEAVGADIAMGDDISLDGDRARVEALQGEILQLFAAQKSAK